MIGRLMVPVAGTIAALIAIALAREPRGPAPEAPPFGFAKPPEHAGPPEDAEPPEVEQGHRFRLEVRAGGTLVDLDEEVTFASAEEFLGHVPGDGHTVVLSKGKEATDAALDEIRAKLEPRFHVSREAPPEPQAFDLELGADGALRGADGTTFASVAALAERIGDARHTLLVSNGKGVTEKDLDETLARLRDANPRFQVRKVYRAPEAPAGD